MDGTANSYQGSPQQDAQWRRHPDGPAGRIQAVIEIGGNVEPAGLFAALEQVVARHESLRTTFGFSPGIRLPLQVIHDELTPAWRLAEPTEVGDLSALAATELREPLNFENGPLVRGALLSAAPDRHQLVLTLSSLCADPASITALVTELAAFYAGTAEPGDEPLQYPDFAAWAVELADSQDDEATAARRDWAAWQDAKAPELPFERPSGDGTIDETVVDLDGAAPADMVHAAWYAVIARNGGDDEITVAYLSPDRRHADLDGAVGAVATAVPLAVALTTETSFKDLAEQVRTGRDRTSTLADYAPLETTNPLAIGFTDYDAAPIKAGEAEFSLTRLLTTEPGWGLWLSCPRDGGSAAHARIYFDPARHDRDFIAGLGRQVRRLTQAAAPQPSTAVAALPLLDEGDRAHVLSDFNQTDEDGTATRFHERFSLHARIASDRTAVRSGGRELSYGELEARANQLANRLRDLGVGPDRVVALFADRSLEMVVALLGILKAGGAYLPVNPEHPAARLQAQLTTAEVDVILATEALKATIPDWPGTVIALDAPDELERLAQEPDSAPDPELSDDNLAYVIFTSGSTGEPKGVAVTHGNVANYVADIVARLGADKEPHSFGLITSIVTDLGNTCLFGALASGGTLVVLSADAAADAGQLATELQGGSLHVLKITPSHLGALTAGGDGRPIPTRTLVLGGERAPWDLIEAIRGLSSTRILNHYGPTETTVGSCTFPVPEDGGPLLAASVPIGRPISGTRCYVLGAEMEPVPVGVAGTLFIGGRGVTRGYLGQPELTGERFVPDPFGSSDDRLYNTGDVVRWLPDGAIEFLGRADEQVKIRGYRVEPAEVEAALRSHQSVSETAVLAVPREGGDPRLAAYVVASDGATEQQLADHAAQFLPEYMLPSAVVLVDHLPRTPSGKIDRKALPEPTFAAIGSAEYVAPRTPTEKAIAAIWAQTLGLERVGATDDFFELGGHSLLATQVVAQVRTELAVDLPLHSLFTCPTVELLAAEIVQMIGAADADDTDQLLSELEGLSDEEVERLLADEAPGEA